MTLPGYENIGGMSKRAIESIDLFLLGIMQHPRSSPIISKEIETKMELTGPEVRAIVSHLRAKGAPIASGGNGYFWARTYNELGLTVEHLKARICKMSIVLSGLESPNFYYPNEDKSKANQGELL